MPTNDPLHNFIQPLKRITLEQGKAQQMRAALSEYADLHTVMSAAPRPTHSFFAPRLWGALVAALVLLVGSTGVTFASESALPGDPLYPVKVQVSEPIQGALKVSTVAKAKWSNELADRRLTEATTLAAQDKLSTSTSVYLQTQVEQEVAKSSAASMELASTGDVESADSVRSDLDARLAAHADLLAFITPRIAATGNATSTAQVLALLTKVQEVHATISASTDTSAPVLAAKIAVVVDPTAASGDATTTPAKATATVAIADSHTPEEQALFTLRRTALLKLLPAALQASTSATSTVASTTVTATSSVPMQTATSSEIHIPEKVDIDSSKDTSQ